MADTISLSGVRALVVEDSWQVANAITRLAENTGMVVIGPAATVAEAEQLLLTLTPDVAIVDINLRGEMAYGLIERLHEKVCRSSLRPAMTRFLTSRTRPQPFSPSRFEPLRCSTTCAAL